MSPWFRLIGLFLLVALVAVVLRELPPPLVLAGLLGGGTYAWWRLRGRAKSEADDGGLAAMGLQRADRDPFGIADLPLALLARGFDRVVDNVVWGLWHRRELRGFELRYTPARGLGENRFLCALVGIDASCPRLVIEPVTFLSLPAELEGLDAVDTGSSAFDRVFSVRGDGSFAQDLLDDRMRGWLLGLGEDLAFEVSGRLVLCYTKRDPNDLMPLLLGLAGFLDRMPKEIAAVAADAARLTAPHRPVDRDPAP